MVRMNLKWTKLKKFNHIFFKEKATWWTRYQWRWPWSTTSKTFPSTKFCDNISKDIFHLARSLYVEVQSTMHFQTIYPDSIIGHWNVFFFEPIKDSNITKLQSFKSLHYNNNFLNFSLKCHQLILNISKLVLLDQKYRTILEWASSVISDSDRKACRYPINTDLLSTTKSGFCPLNVAKTSRSHSNYFNLSQTQSYHLSVEVVVFIAPRIVKY